VLEEPAYDAAKWKVIQPTDSPSWLEDSSAPVAWDTAYLHLHYAKALETSHPEVANLFKNMKLTTDEVSAMTYALVIDKKDPGEYAKAWVKEHEAEVLGWMSQ
jgi:glycine betaine/proline transport system substrate-binding protein